MDRSKSSWRGFRQQLLKPVGLTSRRSQQFADIGIIAPRQLFGCSLRDQSARLHHGNPVGQQHGLSHVVRDHDRRQSQFGMKCFVVVAQRIARQRIERAERFVHQHDLRSCGEGARNTDALTLSSGHFLRQPIAMVAMETHQIDQFIDSLRNRALMGSKQARCDADIVGDRHVREQAAVLKYVSDASTQRDRIELAHVNAVHADHTVVRFNQAIGQSQHRRLAGARAADNRQELAGTHLERHILDSLSAPTREAFADVLIGNGGRIGCHNTMMTQLHTCVDRTQLGPHWRAYSAACKFPRIGRSDRFMTKKNKTPEPLARKVKQYVEPFRVDGSREFHLKFHLPMEKAGLDKDAAHKITDINRERIRDLQEKLYAQDRWSMLLIFQGMDAAGKDSAIENVMSGINPQGCEVYSFKQPSPKELDHDFMWRCTNNLPERGRIGIFNRSYYEELLVVRVHPEVLAKERIPASLVTKNIWRERFEDISAFEKYLARNGTLILKFFLNVSKEEQRKRFLDRLDEPAKNWKFSLGDVAERALWDKYQSAYQDMLRHTSAKHAPWFVVPADHKWFARAVISSAMVSAMEKLDLQFPEPEKAKSGELKKARDTLEKEGREPDRMPRKKKVDGA